ncbi:hypothetical protein FPOAC2_04539 [Fusarium poae]
MIRFGWECMILLTLRGVTKGKGSHLDDEPSNKRGPSGSQDKATKSHGMCDTAKVSITPGITLPRSYIRRVNGSYIHQPQLFK